MLLLNAFEIILIQYCDPVLDHFIRCQADA